MSLVWQASTLPNSLFLSGMTEKMAKGQAQKATDLSQCVRPSQLDFGLEYSRDYFCVADG